MAKENRVDEIIKGFSCLRKKPTGNFISPFEASKILQWFRFGRNRKIGRYLLKKMEKGRHEPMLA